MEIAKLLYIRQNFEETLYMLIKCAFISYCIKPSVPKCYKKINSFHLPSETLLTESSLSNFKLKSSSPLAMDREETLS